MMKTLMSAAFFTYFNYFYFYFYNSKSDLCCTQIGASK